MMRFILFWHDLNHTFQQTQKYRPIFLLAINAWHEIYVEHSENPMKVYPNVQLTIDPSVHIYSEICLLTTSNPLK